MCCHARTHGVCSWMAFACPPPFLPDNPTLPIYRQVDKGVCGREFQALRSCFTAAVRAVLVWGLVGRLPGEHSQAWPTHGACVCQRVPMCARASGVPSNGACTCTCMPRTHAIVFSRAVAMQYYTGQACCTRVKHAVHSARCMVVCLVAAGPVEPRARLGPQDQDQDQREHQAGPDSSSLAAAAARRTEEDGLAECPGTPAKLPRRRCQ